MKTLLGAGVLVAVMAAGAISSDALDEVGQPSGPAKEQREQQRDFVSDKLAWTTCVGQAARDRTGERGRFDPEEACGDKPHPHDGTDRQRAADPGRAHGQHRGRPDWAGGPEKRTAEPPGLAKKGPRD